MGARDNRFVRAAEFLRGQRRWVAAILVLTAGTALLRQLPAFPVPRRRAEDGRRTLPAVMAS